MQLAETRYSVYYKKEKKKKKQKFSKLTYIHIYINEYKLK